MEDLPVTLLQAWRSRSRTKLLLAPLALLLANGCSASASYGALKRLIYETPGRDAWQKPGEVVAALALAGGERVADLGAGGGYFTFPLAQAVGSSGRIYAVDVDASLLAYVGWRARARGLTQIETILASGTDSGLADQSVDLIFLANVFHHLPAPRQYFARLRTALRPGGRIAIVESSAEGSRHATAASEIVAALQAAGFTLAQVHTFLPGQSYQLFVPIGR